MEHLASYVFDIIMEHFTHYVFGTMLIICFAIDLRDKKNRISKLGTLNYEMPFILGYRLFFFVVPILFCTNVVFRSDFNNYIDYINTIILLILNGMLTYLIYKYISVRNSIYTNGIVFFETAINWDDVLSYKFEEVEDKSFLRRNKTRTHLIFHACYKHQRTTKEKDIRFIIPNNQINSVSDFMETIKLHH